MMGPASSAAVAELARSGALAAATSIISSSSGLGEKSDIAVISDYAMRARSPVPGGNFCNRK
jgi:hypothetical protein